MLKQEEKPEEPKTGNHFLSKIDELNKKLTNIREALINKKSTDHPRESLENFISREKERSKKASNTSPAYKEEQNYTEEVIFEKRDEARQEKVHPYKASQPRLDERHAREDDRESVDTYLQEIGH